MQQEERQQAEDAMEAVGREFFPDSGTGTSSASASESPFVTLQWNAEQIPLTDVPLASWFAPYVRDAVERGVVSGYTDASGRPSGTFGPERPVSVEEVAKMALLVSGHSTSGCPSKARNAGAAGRWSLPFISCAESLGWTIYSDGTVDVSRPALRQEVVLTVLEAFGVTPQSLTGINPFSDVTAATQFASSILRAAADGIIGGYTDASGRPTGQFGPDRTITRAEIAKVLSLARQLYGEE